MKNNASETSSKEKQYWWEERLEQWVLRLLRWQWRIAQLLQQKMQRLSPADQRRVWFFYVVGFSCCVSVVMVRPFIWKDDSPAPIPLSALHSGHWDFSSTISGASFSLFPPLYNRFSKIFNRIHPQDKSERSKALVEPIETHLFKIKLDSLCKP